MMLVPYLSSSLKPLPYHHHHHHHHHLHHPQNTLLFNENGKKETFAVAVSPITQLSRFTASAAKSGGSSLNPFSGLNKKCETCRNQGAIECPGCKGTGRNKKNGNIFERWKCFECQGFGLKSCPQCGKGGLTPEQRGER